MSVADNAVGAILEIPQTALDNILKAENAIKKLQATSAEAAGNVNLHWGEVATNGLDKFIQKLAEAKEKMSGLGTINVTLNTQSAVQSSEQLSSATQKTSADVSKAAQDMAQSWNDLSKVSLKGFDPTDYGNNITEIKVKLAELKKEHDNLFVKGATNQALGDEIRQIEEYIRLYRLATEEKNKALNNVQQRQQSQTDKAYLDEQKRLLADILDLRKQVNGQKIKVVSGRITKSDNLEKDSRDLQYLVKRYQEAQEALEKFNQSNRTKLSSAGESQARTQELAQENAMLKEQRKYYDEVTSAMRRRNELVAQPLKARMGSSDEAVIQRQINTSYKEMLKIIAEIGEVKAKAAGEGRSVNATEINLIRQLLSNYHAYGQQINAVSSAYKALSDAAQEQFNRDKSTQLARNATLLADEQNKAAEAARKVAEAKAKDKVRDESASLTKQNSLLSEQLRLQKQLNDLVIKKNVAQASGGDLIPKDEQRITAYVNRLATIQTELDKLSKYSLRFGDDNKRAFDTRAQQAHIAMLGEESRATTKLASEMHKIEQLMQTTSKYPSIANAVLDTSAVESKKQQIQQAIKGIESSITALHPKFQEAMNVRMTFIDPLRQQINELGQAMIKLSQAQGGGWHPNMQPYLDAINQLRAELSKIQQESANLIGVKDVDNWIKTILQEYDNLYAKIRQMQQESGVYDTAKAKLEAVNNAIQQQIQKITDNEAQIEKLNQAFVRLNATQKAYDANGNLTTQAKNIYDKIEALKEENRLLKQNATEAGKDNVSKNLARYKELEAELKRINKLQDDLKEKTGSYYAKGSSPEATQFNNYVNQAYAISQEMQDIERKNINEITQYRQQKDQEQLQDNLSKFIQNEAQKTAEAKRQADERTRYQQEQSAKYFSSYKGSLNYANAVLGDSVNRGMAVNNYENRERAIKNLETAIKNLNKADSDYENKLKSLSDALKRLKDAQNDVNNAMKQSPKQATIADANQARKIAEQTKTLKDYETAYKMLIEVMKQTPQGRAFDAMNAKAREMKTHIDQIKKKMGEFHSQTSKTSNVMGQLQGRIATAFSIGAITGFLKKVTEVRAQFELQRVALGAIIQDRDEANKIFTQVQNMALESPFNIMQLEKATKQIAAFGFETKKLVPTMKMFADISAGLGVEIDRLVLVMGHLKARNFLEGTMVRQFTNMGFNVLGELSKYYSELEDKMVSVGEVQDRVKKKMVSFEDVEEVLKRVTSAGGMFYDMQKKQSESIWGQMQRITDAYDLMMNEIGQSNEGTIKEVLTLVRNLINSWRDLKPYIVSAVTAVGTYMTVATGMKVIPLFLSNITNGFKMMGVALGFVKKEQVALNATMMRNPYAAAAAAITGIIMLLAEWYNSQSKLNESMDRVRSEGISNMYDLIIQYKKLADTVKDTTKSYDERKEAMDELNRVYKDILPNTMLEIDNIRKMKDGYKEATEAIRAYSAEKIKSNLKAEVENQFSKDITDATSEIAHMMTMFFNNWKSLPTDMKPDTFYSMAQTIITEFAEEIKNGEVSIDGAVDKLKARMIKRLEGIVSKADIDKAFKKLPKIDDGLEDWFESLQKYVDNVKGIDLGIESAQQRIAQPEIERFEALKKAVSDYINALKNLKDEYDKGNITGFSLNDDGKIANTSKNEFGLSALQSFGVELRNVQSLTEAYGYEFNITADDINNAIQSNVDMMGYQANTQYDIFSGIINKVSEWGEALLGNDFFLNWLEDVQNKADGVKFTGIRKEIADTQRDIVKKFGLTEAVFDKFKWDGMNSYSDVQKQAKQLTDEAKKQIKEIAAVRMEMILLGHSAAEAQQIAEQRVGISEAEAKERMKAYEAEWKAFGGSEKDNKSKSKKSTDKELKRWQDLKKAIEDVSTAYDKYRKSFTVEESNKRIEELFGDTFKELGSDIRTFYKDGKYDASELIKALEVLKGMTKATTEERKKFRSEIERKIGTTQVEIEVKMREDAEKKLKADLDEMFANYELSEELKKIGVNVDLTYMVGGKPTTLQDIRDEIARLKAEGGDKEDAENRIKILEEQEKKITQIELKEQKERLKNYEKYLKKMYSDRAKTMIESYTTLSQMEADFQKNIQQLESEMNASDTTVARKEELAGLIASLRNQATEAALGIQRELGEALAKADWNSFKGSEIFEAMYQDLDTLSKKGIDALIKRLEIVRDKLQSVSDIDPKAVREVTQYIEKLRDAKINLAPMEGFKTALNDAKALKKEYGSVENAQLKLIELNDNVASDEQRVSDLETIISLTERGVEIKGLDEETTIRLKNLQSEYGDDLQGALLDSRDKLKADQNSANALSKQVQSAKSLKDSYEKQIAYMDAWKEKISSITDSVFNLMDAFGLDIDDEWQQLGQSIIDATFQAVALQLQLKMLEVEAELLGVAMNSALGIIGWIATGLQVVANLLMAIFAAHDKRLEKQIGKLQDRVDSLSKGFEKLQKSIERAFNISTENSLTEQALDNLEQQKQAYEEMIRLEEAKKKTDDDKIKEYKEKLEELAEAEEELYEKRHEKYGSTNNVWDEANNWVDAWLDAYKETGDGLDALNNSWDEFYENLVKKQATSAVVGKRMQDYIDRINKVIDSNMDEYGYVDAFKEIGESFKADSAEWNRLLKEFFEYAGIGSDGKFILSDLQKGIQNITEPQAAAIEAYLNSMRFAVFRHTEQLDTLIATIQAQYGNGNENPVVTELKGIRGVLDSIYSTLRSVVKTGFGEPYVKVN